MRSTRQPCLWVVGSLALIVGAMFGAHPLVAAGGEPYGPPNVRPWFIRGEILETRHDPSQCASLPPGEIGCDDLLTAGLGQTGLGSGALPAIADPVNPTAAELRRRAIHSNYRALVDTTTGGGYGTLYGPTVPLSGAPPLPDLVEGRIPGDEFLAFASIPLLQKNVTMMVQVPSTFDPYDPCIVTAPSSGSRGVYGAIATAGEWGLKRGCAVAYTDKGTGTGAHNLGTNTCNLITGERADAAAAGRDCNFRARLSEDNRAEFNAETPNRFAFKHAHSQENPEALWGQHVLQSIELAFFVLNEKFGYHHGGKVYQTITPEKTIVIASSVSNGGGASMRAAEQDKKGLIDGVAVSEPNVNPEFRHFGIKQGDRPVFFDHSKSLYDYTTLLNVYQGCANRDPAAGALLNLTPAALGENRCASLREKGLLTTDTLLEQAAEAQQILNDSGILPEQNIVQPSHWFLNVAQSIAKTYADAYGRFSVRRNLCGFSFGASDGTGNPIPLSAAAEAVLFGVSNGIPPTGGVNLINNDAVGGATENRVSVSASTNRQDQNLDGALCLRALATGVDPENGNPLRGGKRIRHERIAFGIEQIRASGDLNGIPTVYATGRSDAILALNHTSRAYVGLNRLVERRRSNLRYYEVTNAQHLDVLNGVPGFNERFIPLHHYFIQALDLMYEHLKHGTRLPPSQVIRTTPRGTGAPQITLANLPPIEQVPDPGARIRFQGGVLRIPE